MKKIKITTPENIEVEYTLADIGSRTAAAVIDFLLQGVAIVFLFIVILLIAYLSPEFWREYYGWILGISIIIFGIISFGYFIITELSMNGMTFGKRKLNIRTIRKNGMPITLSHSAIRNFFRIFIDIYGVGVVLIFFTKDHKRVGDMLASTIVVAEEGKTQPLTLESLQAIDEKLSYYISEEESALLREYFERRASMEDFSILRAEIKLHFTRKFTELNILNEWQEYIDKL